MDRRALRQKFKQITPAPVARGARAVETCLRRIVAWLGVARDIRGRSTKDREVLRRSLAVAPVEIFRDLDHWREPTLIEDAEIEVKGLGTFAVRCHSDDLGHVLPNNLSDIFATVRARVREGDIAIDAGSNIGAVAVCMAARAGPSGRVIAVEMMPDTAARLRLNLALNGLDWVTVIELALSDVAGRVVTAHVEAGVFGQASIMHGAGAARATDRVEVATTTLDEVTEGLGEIALIKMDLEGAEPQALRGATDTLRRVRAIIFESWQGEDCETARVLRDAGFCIAPVDARNFLATRESGS